MKKTTSFFISILLSACFLLSCASPTPAPSPTQPPVIENTPLPTQAVFTPIPTLTAEILPTEAFPTFVASTTAPGQPTVIQFPANGTYEDITGSFPDSTSKTYSVNAMKGQIMSVSVVPFTTDGYWSYIPLQIKGADGSILCPQSTDSDCLAWRGALPASQDYFITLNAAPNVAQFVLRVAINPPGSTEQFFQFHNVLTGASLTYSDAFAPMLPVTGNYKTTPELALYLNDQEIYEQTNLGEVYLFLSSNIDPQIVATCTEPNPNGGGPEEIIGNEVINGFTFVHSTSGGVGAGNLYEQEIYRMAYNNACYEVIYFLHSSNIGNYTPGAVTEFDRNAIIQKLSSVFSTFTIK